MSYNTRMKGLLGAAALSLMLLPALTSSASAACAGSTFINAGCFSAVSAQYFYPDTTLANAIDGDFVQVYNAGNNNPVLTLSGASGLINYVTLDFKAYVGLPSPIVGPAFNLSLTGLGSNGFQTFTVLGTGSPTIGSNGATPVNVTFFSAIGIFGPNLSLNFQANRTDGLTTGNTYAELGNIAVAAPAPIPGAGFLSFLGMGFAGMFRRGRALLSRVAGRKSVAQAA